MKNNNLCEKLIVLYSGNIGFTHNVEVIIKVAKLLSVEDNVEFLIIDEGGKKKLLIEMAKQNNLKNCSFIKWKPHEELLFSLAFADLAFVVLNDKQVS